MHSATETNRLSIWKQFVNFLSKIGFNPLGLGSLVFIALLPFIPPFNQEHMIRWLITGAFLAAQSIAFDFQIVFL